jgi:hypothetical protein
MFRTLALAAIVLAASELVRGQPAATLTTEALLADRLGVTTADVARFRAGEILASSVPASAPNEIATAGAMRTTGDLRRLLAWLKDI